MKRSGVAWVIGCLLVTATCTAGSSARPPDGSAAEDVLRGSGGGGGAGRAGGSTGIAGDTEGAPATGGTGGARGSSCPCGDGLAVDLVGDGDPLHLTSGDYVAADHPNLPVADVANADAANPSSGFTVVSACLAAPRPWAEATTGGFSNIYWIQACSGPGNAPPCVWLNANATNPISWGSLYVDRSGREIRGNIDSLQSSFRSFETPLGETIEGTFAMPLQDGRKLTATFRVCLLATISAG